MVITTEEEVISTLELISATSSRIESNIYQDDYSTVDENLDKIILYCNEIKHYFAPPDDSELCQWQIDDIPF